MNESSTGPQDAQKPATPARFLNKPAYRFGLILILFLILGAMYFLKVWQVHEETKMNSQPAPIWAWGLCRRVDDISFWGVIALILACFSSRAAASASGRTPTVRMTRREYWLCLISSLAGICVYLKMVSNPKDPGVFFTNDTGTLWWIQRIEGTLMVSAIVIGHFFFILAIAANWRVKVLPVAARRHRVLGATGIFVAVFATFMVVTAIASFMTDFCTGCAGWPSTGPDKFLCFMYVAAVWWPLLILAPLTCWNLQYI